MLVFIVFLGLASCTEDIVIDIEEGEPMIGVEASFTDELKHHEAILLQSFTVRRRLKWLKARRFM